MAFISTCRIGSIGGPRTRWSSTWRFVSLCRTACIGVLLIAGLASVVSAQQYQADKIDPAAQKLGAVAQGCVKVPANFTSSQQQFDDYFKGYYFPAMTQFGPDDLAKLGKLRYELFSLWLWGTQNEELQKDLTDLALEKMKSVAANPGYHPAVRYNAILVIGMLDDKYGIAAAGNQRPPKPHARANALLVALVNTGIQGKPIVTPSLMVGALIGLERHAQYHEGLEPAAIAAMTKAAIKLATTDPPMADVDGKVAEWIRIEAATVLAKLGTAGQNNDIQDALVSVLSDSKLNLDRRCEVAGLLGLVSYKDAKIDGKTTVDKMLQLTVEVAQAENKRAKDFQELSITGGGGMSMSRMERGGGRGRGESYSPPGDHSKDYDRKVLLSRLGDLKKGFVAIKPVVPADRAPAVETIVSSLQTVIEAASKQDTTDLDLVEKVRKAADTIQAAAKGGTATAAAKPAADAF
jgi:hypothetical protein